MDTILITGAGPNGVTGRLIKEYYIDKYHLLTPSSKELDLTNDIAVSDFFDKNNIDYVIHCATFRPHSIDSSHMVDEELESNLRMYFSLAAQSHRFKRMIYFGSGAEFDKSKPICNVSENDFGKSIPKNKYGLGKYIMNSHARRSDNIYNLRLFGTICKYERPTKNVVSNICAKAVLGLPLSLRQDCKFSFIDIKDVLPIIDKAITSNLQYHEYNLSIDIKTNLSDIVKIVESIASHQNEYFFLKPGYNLEYTADNTRMKEEFSPRLTPLVESIKSVYDYLYYNRDSINESELDKRWQ